MNYDLTIYKPEDSPKAMFYASPAQKGSARGRTEDIFFVQISPTSSKGLDTQSLSETIETQAKLFYKTSGSVTKAIRVFVDGLNRAILQSNSRFDEPETWQMASLCLGVIHADTLFIAQVGQSSTHVLRPDGDEQFFDPELDRRGLGVSTVVNLRYFQTSLQGNESLLFLPDPLSGSDGESQYEAVSEPGAAQAFVQIRPGKGMIEYKSLEDYQEEPQSESEMSVEEAVVVDLPTEDPGEYEIEYREELAEDETIPYVPSLAEDLFSQAVLLPDEPELIEDSCEMPTEEIVLEDTTSQEPVRDFILVENEPEETEALQAIIEEPKREPRREAPDLSQIKEKALQGLASGAGWLRRAEERAESVVSAGRKTDDFSVGVTSELSPWAKILIAVVVPLILVFVTSLIYFNRGEDHQYQYFLAQAQASVANSPLMQTEELQRKSWEQAMNWINQAATYKDSAEVKALRAQAQNALDKLDGAQRLQFVPAYAASLFPDLQISALVSLNNDLYLLDKTSGSVKYMRLHSSGYEMVQNFTCGPGKYEGVEVGKLVDMISVPLNNPAKSPILAIDKAGNLLYCGPTGTATAISLQMPDRGWSNLSKIIFDSNRLYVLDPGNSALWIYRGMAANFSDPARPYFDDDSMQLLHVIDFEVEGEELFLLYEDGHSAHCLSSSITGLTTCENPYPYLNTEGVDSDLDVEHLSFNRLSYSPPPDPSIYFLEPQKAQLYQFSLRLNLNKVLRFGSADGSLPGGDATAFFVSPDRRVFLAFGNQLYHALLP